MAITSHPSNSGTTGTLTPTLNFGFTANAGDLIIAITGSDSAITSHTYGGSWVEFGAEWTPSGARGSTAYLIASGGETTDSVTGGGTGDRWECIYVRIPAGEWHGTTPPERNTAVIGTNGSPDPGNIAPSWGSETNNIFIAGLVTDDSAAPSTTGYPANYSTAQNVSQATTSSANIAVAVRILTAASDDPGAFTLSTADGWGAIGIAVRPPAAGTVVTPTTLGLTLTTFAPTVTASDHKTVTPTTLALTTSTFAPTVTASDHQTVTPTTATLTLATFAPTVSIGVNVVPTTLGLTLTTFAPTVTATAHQLVTPTTLGLTLSTFAPTVSTTAHVTATPDTAALTLATFAPTVSVGDVQVVTPDPASLTLAAFAPTVALSDHQTVTPTTASLALTAFAPDAIVSDHKTITPATATLVLTGFAPDIGLPVIVTPTTLALALATFAPTVSAGIPSGATASVSVPAAPRATVGIPTVASAGISRGGQQAAVYVPPIPEAEVST